MIFSLLTVLFFTASSLGDKYISANMQCNAKEFSFLVSASTATFLGLILPFVGWSFSFSWQSTTALAVLILCKIAEFYTSAALLKTVSAYELKAWLSLNVIISFLADLLRGIENFFVAFLPCTVVLITGVCLITFGRKNNNRLRYVFLSMVYVASKFLYGLQMNTLATDVSPVSVLFLVMLCIAVLQLPFINIRIFFHKKGLLAGASTRIFNTAGLWTEAAAAQQNLLLYSLVQPMQLAILFAVALIRQEKIGKCKLVGSILTLISVTAVTILIYYN